MFVMGFQISGFRFQIQEAGDGVVGDLLGDLLRRLGPLRAEPVRGPVQRAEEGARGDGGVRRVQHPRANPAGDERADAALVRVALGDDPGSEAGRQSVDLEMRGGAFDFVHEAEDVGDRHVAQAVRERPSIPARGGQRAQQPIDRTVLAEEEELVLAAEVVIQVAGREIGCNRDVAHARVGEPARAEDARRRAHDLHAAGVRSK